MRYLERVKSSFRLFWQNPALLSVILLGFMLGLFVGMLFLFGDLTIISSLNKDALAALPQSAPPEAFLAAVLNIKTAIVFGLLLLMQLFIMVYIESFFKAGFYGMLKNMAKDGSTVFAEFFPEAKRHWHAFFRFLLVRDVAFLLIGLPVILAGLSLLGTTPGFVTDEQSLRMLISFLFSGILFLLVNFWLLYGELLIVFRQENAIGAIKGSARMAHAHLGATLVALLTFFWIFMLGMLLSNLINLPFTVIAQQTQSQAWGIADSVVGFFLNIVTLSASIIANIYLTLIFVHLSEKSVKPAEKLMKRKKSRA